MTDSDVASAAGLALPGVPTRPLLPLRSNVLLNEFSLRRGNVSTVNGTGELLLLMLQQVSEANPAVAHGVVLPSAEEMSELYGPKRDPLYVVIPITIIYLLIFVSGVVGNISTCIVIAKNKSMHTATNYYLFSLAVSDFVLLISGVPQEIYFIWSKYPYVFGEAFCVLRGIAAETSANATVLTITAFTVERYVAICHPFLSHTLSKLSRAVRIIIVIWLIAVVSAVPQALQFGITSQAGMDQCVVKRIIIAHSFELSTFLFFFAPMTLITVLYALIGLKLRSSALMPTRGSSLQHRSSSTLSPTHRQSSIANSQCTRRVLKMLVAVVVAFFLCWAPFHAQRLVYIYGVDKDHQPSDPLVLKLFIVTTYISGILYYLSTCINPLLYNIMSNKFRQAFKSILFRKRCPTAVILRHQIARSDHTEYCLEDSEEPLQLKNRPICQVIPSKTTAFARLPLRGSQLTL
ncbi:pyrokinin-1 receptor isoform X2 [Anopheles darlingi]|uniref:pyrokinin-1 receptor isoform X2 n=1 Tax=Anopheles darlingi TaxID=43151 RepID=UPI0021005663|nr:pyrokinin-1 receptor isoform X2 [Anopheles darlingi]